MSLIAVGNLQNYANKLVLSCFEMDNMQKPWGILNYKKDKFKLCN